jgi:hypothetical protein
LIGGDPNLPIASQGYSYFFGKMIAGGLAGTTTWFFAYPFDVVKSLSQSASFNQDHGKMSMLNITRYILKTYGLKAFFHGLSSCLSRAFLVNAFCFVTYEWCAEHLNIWMPGKNQN